LLFSYHKQPTYARSLSTSVLQIFFTERFEDIAASNPAIQPSDRCAMLSAASVFWAEAANPKLKTFREKLQVSQAQHLPGARLLLPGRQTIRPIARILSVLWPTNMMLGVT
jgi:hypothetical protein